MIEAGPDPADLWPRMTKSKGGSRMEMAKDDVVEVVPEDYS